MLREKKPRELLWRYVRYEDLPGKVPLPSGICGKPAVKYTASNPSNIRDYVKIQDS